MSCDRTLTNEWSRLLLVIRQMQILLITLFPVRFCYSGAVLEKLRVTDRYQKDKRVPVVCIFELMPQNMLR